MTNAVRLRFIENRVAMEIPSYIKKVNWLITAFLLLNIAGCAKPKDPQDPLEPLNRQFYAFNEVVDAVVYRPVAKTYNFILPNYLQARVTDFFNNVDEIPTVANDILQLNVNQTLMDSSRFVVNSTFGIAGLYDPATKYDLPLHHSDVGLTLARWGYKKSAYFVIPFVGPSTIRDAIGMPPNIYLSVWPYVNPWWVGYATFALNKVNQRAALLPTDKLIKDAYDPYVFVRDAYLQYRQGQIDKIGTVNPGAGTATGATSTGAAASNAPSDSGDTFVSATDDNSSSTTTTPNAQNDGDTYVAPGSTTKPVSTSVTNIFGSKPALEAHSKRTLNNNNQNNNTVLPSPTVTIPVEKHSSTHSQSKKTPYAHLKHKSLHAAKNIKKNKKVAKKNQHNLEKQANN